MPTVSVTIPAYNGVSRYLEQAIESVLAQTHRDFELIVVDDASKDETARLVLCFPHARYFGRAQNGGQAVARNDGARLAKGELVAFLDQDDLWESTFLEETVQAFATQLDATVIHTDGYTVNERNEILTYDRAMKHTATITHILNGGHDVATSGSIFRKAHFEAVGGYDEQLPIWEDTDLAIRLYQRFRVIHFPKPLYRHRVYSHNVSRDIPSERALLGRQRFLEKHAPSCKPGTPEERALGHDWSRFYGDLGKHHLREKCLDEARRYFWLSVRHHPFNRKAVLRLLRSYLLHRSQSQTVS